LRLRQPSVVTASTTAARPLCAKNTSIGRCCGKSTHRAERVGSRRDNAGRCRHTANRSAVTGCRSNRAAAPSTQARLQMVATTCSTHLALPESGVGVDVWRSSN
jgi:hypothetical protein